MKTFARSVNGVVVETIATTADIATLFHPGVGFVDCTATAGVAQGWTYDGTTFAAPVTTTARALAALASYRYGREIAGVMFQPSGASAPLLFATDRESRSNLMAAVMATTMGAWPTSAPWKTAAGTFVAVTGPDLEALAKKCVAYVSACYANESALAVEVAQTVTADITVGWPSNA